MMPDLSFSQRYGFTPVRDQIQVDSLDQQTRVQAWNLMTLALRSQGDFTERSDFLIAIWSQIYQQPLDELPSDTWEMSDLIKQTVLEGAWFSVYDIIEFFGKHQGLLGTDVLTSRFNEIFTRNLAGYRFVGDRLARVTTEGEVEAIEEALVDSGPFSSVHHHLDNALAKLSDRQNPDYANSIKESISAVEAATLVVTGEKDIKSALANLRNSGRLHPALEEGWKKLYGFTSDASGVRHGKDVVPTVDLAIARYFATTCAAFVSFLLTNKTD